MRTVLALALLVPTVAACGAAASAATTRAEYEQVVTRLLDSIAEPIAELEGASAYDDLVDGLEEAEERAHEAAHTLHELEPPPDLTDENEVLEAALEVLAEDLHRAAETLTTLQEEGMPPEFPALIETLGAIEFEGVALLRDAVLRLRNEGIEPGGAR